MTIPPFNYPAMELLCKELNERTTGARVIECLPNDLLHFYLVLEKEDRRESLLFCFSPPFIRFHLTSTYPRSESSHPLHAYLKNALLIESTLLQQDRILQLTFHTPREEYRLICEFFPKHPNYYLIQSDDTIAFSLHRLERTHYQMPVKHSQPSNQSVTWLSHQEIEKAYSRWEKEWEFKREKQVIRSEMSKEIRKLQKKKNQLLENLQQCTRWADVQHEGELIKSQFSSIKKGAASIVVHDWLTDQEIALNLDPKKTPQEEMALRFRKAKKLQTGIVPLKKYLMRVEDQLQLAQQMERQIDQAATIEELLPLKKHIPQPRQRKENSRKNTLLPYREFLSASGLKIWVGKNAKANDRLTFQLANGRDWWLHIRGCPGSHVIIRVYKDQEPDSETLKDAMQLALYFSKARAQGEGEVCVTQRKYVSKLGKAGQAQISQHQSKHVRHDRERMAALQERSST